MRAYFPDPRAYAVTRQSESLADACRRLVPFARDWRDCVSASFGLDGVIEDQAVRDELAAIDAFLAACAAGGLGT